MPSSARSALSVILTLCCALALALVAPFGALADGPTISFAAAANYDLATNAYAWDVAFGDLDNDGDLDMVATETVNNRIGVRKGVGNGTFGFQTNYTSADHPTAIVIADLNRDGDLDVAVSCADSDVVTVFLGNGTGALGSDLDYSVGDYPAHLAGGDVDNDGDIDLVSVNRNADTVSVIRNGGDATFGAATNYSVGDGPLHVVLADLNRDGWLDMAVSNHTDGDLSVLLSDNAGSFNAAVDYPVDMFPNGVTAGDFNGDGAPDLAVANEFWGNVSVLLNDGGGTFASAVYYAVGSTPYKVVAVDLNRDGALDLAVTNLMSDDVSVLTGVGDGTFGAQTTFVAGDWPLGITSADLNGDGKPDLAVASNSYSGDVYVLLNDTDIPASLLGEATNYSLGDYPGALALGDLDLDGDLDLVTSSDADTIVHVSLNDGVGAYTSSTSVAINSYAIALALADVDHDGDLDLVTTNPDSPASSASVRLGDGAGGFSGSTVIVLGDSQNTMALGDVNGDGDLDLLTAGYYGGGNVLMGDGAGGFSGTGTLTVGNVARGMALGDIDHDGDLDVVVAASQSNVISVRLNDGAGVFSGSTEVSVGAGSSPVGVVLADVDYDGNLDLVAACGQGDRASVRLGDGAGNFGGGYDIPTGDGSYWVALGDVDRDGLLDLVVTNYNGDTASFRLGEGDGDFSGGADLAVGDTPRWVALGDVNTDGILDAVVANWNSNNVSVLLGEEEGPVLRITKAVTPADPSWGETLTYTIQISNTGPITATGVMITDTFPIDYVTDVNSASVGVTITNTGTGATWGWTVADMAPGASGTITLTGVLKDYVMFGDVFTNTAEIGCAEGVTATASVEATVGSDCVSTFTVISNADAGPGTLRQGLAAVCDGGTIDFNLTYPATITLTSGELVAGTRCTIQGPGADKLDISGDDTYRILAATVPLTISGLTLRDGVHLTSDGGAIHTSAALSLDSLRLLDNSATDGGAVWAEITETMVITGCLFQGNQAQSGNCGGFYAGGAVEISHSDFISNTASGYNGAFSGNGVVTISDSLFQGNVAQNESLGVFSATGAVVITNTQFISNTASGDYGVFYGGADVTISESRFQGNQSQNDEYGCFWAIGAVEINDSEFVGNTASKSYGVFKASGDVTISGSLFQGNAAGENTGAVSCASGATISNTDFISNTAQVDTGALALAGPLNISHSLFQGNVATTGNHGAIYGFDSVAITHTDFYSNTAGDSAGAAYLAGDASISDSLFQGNRAQNGADGAMVILGTVTLRNSRFEGNWAKMAAGAFAVRGAAVIDNCELVENHADAFAGGVVPLSTAIITATDFYSNTATVGGALVSGLVTDCLVTISGGTFQGNSSDTLGGAIMMTGTGTLSLDGVTLRDNTAAEAGGGLWANGPTWITDSLFVGNVVTDTQGLGGGLYLEGIGGIVASRFQGNDSRGMGGGLALSGGKLGITSAGLLGGGPLNAVSILNTIIVSNTSDYGGAGLLSDGASVVMLDSTVAGNTADGGDGWGTGGGVQLMDVPAASFTNTTIANNEAVGTDDDGGGGIMIYDLASANSQVHLLHCTITGNSTTSTSATGTGGGGISADGTYTLRMTNTLAAGNTSAAAKPDLAATVASGGSNLIGDGTGAIGLIHGVNGDQVGTAASPIAPLVGALGNYGGGTETVPLLPGSPAIDKAGPLAPPKDQRGVTRPQGTASDIGAFEARPFTISMSGGNNQTVAINAAFALPLSVLVTSPSGEPVVGGRVTYTAPATGASAVMSPTLAAIGANSAASSQATANGTPGSYQVTASASGAANGIKFDLTNAPVSAEGSVSGGPATLCPGAELSYTVTVTNTSASESLTNVVITAVLPAGTTYTPGDATGTVAGVYSDVGGQKRLTWTVASLSAGQVATAQLSLGTLATLPHGTVLTALFGWDSAEVDGKALQVVSTISTDGCVSAEATAAGGPASLCPGYNLYYTVVVTNTSPSGALTNVVVTAAVPAGTWFAPGQATGTVNGVYSEAGGVKVVTWNVPSVADGQTTIANLTLHTLSSLANGTVITETFGWEADLVEGGQLAVGSTINTAGCGPVPPADLTISGYVTSGGAGVSARSGVPLAGATVTATLCLPGAWVATTDAEGFYHITFPGDAVASCDEITLEVSAPGHRGVEGTYPIDELRANPARDFVLDRLSKLWLSLVF